MGRVIGCITEQHDPVLLGSALLVCALAWLVGFRLLARAEQVAPYSLSRRIRLGVASLAIGLGSWATHFMAAMAYDPGVPHGYDLGTTIASAELAVAGAAVGLAGTETAIGDAIAIAVKRLAALPEQARVLVLLTDGVNNAGSIAPRDAARAAKAAGVRIYTIGIGATRMRIPGFFGSQLVNPSADLDADMLTDIATQTGGRFFRATDSGELADAYRAIDALEPMPQHGPSLRPRHELFRWPLLAAIALLLLVIVPRRFARAPELPA